MRVFSKFWMTTGVGSAVILALLTGVVACSDSENDGLTTFAPGPTFTPGTSTDAGGGSGVGTDAPVDPQPTTRPTPIQAPTTGSVPTPAVIPTIDLGNPVPAPVPTVTPVQVPNQGAVVCTPTTNGLVLNLAAIVPEGIGDQDPIFGIEIRNLTQNLRVTNIPGDPVDPPLLNLDDVSVLDPEGLIGQTTLDLSFTLPFGSDIIRAFSTDDVLVVTLSLIDAEGTPLIFEAPPCNAIIDQGSIPEPTPEPPGELQIIDRISFTALRFNLSQTSTTGVVGYGPNQGLADPSDPDGPNVLSPEFLPEIDSETEDTDGDGVLDPGEDLNENGVIDIKLVDEPGPSPADFGTPACGEDLNGNGMLDPGEDTNGNGFPDVVNDVDCNTATTFLDPFDEDGDEDFEAIVTRLTSDDQSDNQPVGFLGCEGPAGGTGGVFLSNYPSVFVINQQNGLFVDVLPNNADVNVLPDAIPGSLNDDSVLRNPVILSNQQITITRNPNDILTATITPSNFDELYRINYFEDLVFDIRSGSCVIDSLTAIAEPVFIDSSVLIKGVLGSITGLFTFRGSEGGIDEPSQGSLLGTQVRSSASLPEGIIEAEDPRFSGVLNLADAAGNQVRTDATIIFDQIGSQLTQSADDPVGSDLPDGNVSSTLPPYTTANTSFYEDITPRGVDFFPCPGNTDPNAVCGRFQLNQPFAATGASDLLVISGTFVGRLADTN